jgi:hypothetical protein
MAGAGMTLEKVLARLDMRDAPAGSEVEPRIARTASMEFVGSAIAERLDREVDLVLTWHNVDDAVLGHIVARELGIDNALIFEPAEGQLRFDRVPVAGQRVALLGVRFDRMSSVRAPAIMLASCGAELSQVVAVIASPGVELEGKSKFVLLSDE